MNNLNSIIVEGVVEKSRIKDLPNGFNVCEFEIAVEHQYKNREGKWESEVNYFDCEGYGKLANVCKDRLSKGVFVSVAGRLSQRRWTDSDGRKHSRIVVFCEHVDFKDKGAEA